MPAYLTKNLYVFKVRKSKLLQESIFRWYYYNFINRSFCSQLGTFCIAPRFCEIIFFVIFSY